MHHIYVLINEVLKFAVKKHVCCLWEIRQTTLVLHTENLFVVYYCCKKLAKIEYFAVKKFKL